MGDFNAQIGKRTNPMETASGKFGLGLRNEREILEKKKFYLGRIGNIKEVQNLEYHVPEESRYEMDVEKPKRCNEDRNLLYPNKQARHRRRRNSRQPQTGFEQHQNGRRGGKETIDDQEATESRCHTNRSKEDRIPT